MNLETISIDLAYFILSFAGDLALFLAAALIVGGFLDGLVTAIQVLRR